MRDTDTMPRVLLVIYNKRYGGQKEPLLWPVARSQHTFASLRHGEW